MWTVRKDPCGSCLRISRIFRDTRQNAIERKDIPIIKTLYFEDDPDKCWAVSNVLERGGAQVEHAGHLQEGLQKWEEAAAAGEPYELVVTDMQFPLTPGGPVCVTAGDTVISHLRKKKDSVPVIVCSSMPYQVPGTFGCVWYSERQRWKDELLCLVQSIRNGVT